MIIFKISYNHIAAIGIRLLLIYSIDKDDFKD